MCSDPHRFCRPDLPPRPHKVALLLIHGYSLIDICLHQLVLRVIYGHRHAFVATLSGVPNPLDGLLLRIGIHVGLCTAKRSVCLWKTSLVVHILAAFHLRIWSAFAAFKAKLRLLVATLVCLAARHCTVSALITPTFPICCRINEHLLVLVSGVGDYCVFCTERLNHDALPTWLLLLLIHLKGLDVASRSCPVWTRSP